MLLNVGLLAIEALAIGIVAIALHASSHRYGLAPMLVFLTGLVAVLHALGATPVFVDAWGTRVSVTDSAILPAILASVLMLYDVQGTAVARVTILGIIGVSSLVLTLQVLLPLHLSLAGGFNDLGLPVDSPVYARSAKITTASICAFIVGLAVISVVHQGLRNGWPTAPLWLTPGLALIAALAVDDVVFRLIAFGPEAYLDAFPGGLPGKVASALLLWPLIGAHLSRTSRDELDDRPTLDLLFGSYRQVEQALQSMEARRQSLEIRLETVISHAPVILFGVNREGVVTLSEGAGLDVLGLDHDQVIGGSVYKLFPDIEPLFRRALQGEAFSNTIDVRDISFDATFVPIRSGGKVTGLIGVGIDVTEARQAERALQESEVRFSSTFMHAGVGLVHADLRGGVLMANQAFLDMLGYSVEEMIGRTVSDLTYEEDVDLGLTEMARVISGDGHQFQIDKRYLTADGGIVWCQTTATLVRSPQGTPLYFVVAVEDLTARRATEEQLRQAQKMEAVGQLTGGVAHDFNNLLTVVMGGLEMAIADDGEDPQADGPLQEALRSAERGAELTRQLLAFSRRQALQPVSVDPRNLLAHMQALLVRMLGETIHVEVSVRPGTGSCVADRAQVESAILNLAINARDAMPKGGRLTIAAGPLVADEAVARRDSIAPGRYVELRIEDTGTGMPPDELERAFDPFYTTKDVGKGSGLGLSMVYGFAKQSGGAVHLLSEAEKGVTVRLLLPSADNATVERGEPAVKRKAIGGGGERILLVEDDPGVRRVMTATLKKLGYEVLEAAEATRALEVLETRDDIDLLITDVVLPGRLSGPELAKEVIASHPSLPIMFTSGYSLDALPEFAELSRQIPLLTKPFHRAELASLVAERLS